MNVFKSKAFAEIWLQCWKSQQGIYEKTKWKIKAPNSFNIKSIRFIKNETKHIHPYIYVPTSVNMTQVHLSIPIHSIEWQQKKKNHGKISCIAFSYHNDDENYLNIVLQITSLRMMNIITHFHWRKKNVHASPIAYVIYTAIHVCCIITSDSKGKKWVYSYAWHALKMHINKCSCVLYFNSSTESG